MQQARVIAPGSPGKEILIPTHPRSPLPASVCEMPGHPQDSLCVNPKMGAHTHTHTQAQSDVLLNQATWPFPIAPVDLEGYERSVAEEDRLRGLRAQRILSIPPSRLQPAWQFAFQWLPLSLPLRRPYLQGKCERLERRKPFGDARLGNHFASESKLVFGVNPLVETLG